MLNLFLIVYSFFNTYGYEALYDSFPLETIIEETENDLLIEGQRLTKQDYKLIEKTAQTINRSLDGSNFEKVPTSICIN